MNQEKTGKFIAACRKEKGLTQAALAEKIGITDRAVSKWETGKSMPDASIMLELCTLLGINVNELLEGERIAMDNYKEIAEMNLIEMRKQEENSNRKLLRAECFIGVLTVIASLGMIIAGRYLAESGMTIIGSVLIGLGLLILIAGAIFAGKLEYEAGYYECPECGNRYIPSFKSFMMAVHFGTTRKMKCPKCGRKAYQKKVLSKYK